VFGFGEGVLQKTGIIQSFYRSGKVCPFLVLRRVWSEKKFLPWKKSFLEDGVNYKCDKGIEDRVNSKI
jgi:hypothetical protein